MAKIYNSYEGNIDKTWYLSSNIVYSECEDIEGQLKKVKVVFNGGRTYLYEDVDVNSYLKFRESESQGKAFNQYLKQCKVTKLEDTDLNLLQEELNKARMDCCEITSTNIKFTHGKEILLELTDVVKDGSITTEVLKTIIEKISNYNVNIKSE